MYTLKIKFRDGTTKVFTANYYNYQGNSLVLSTYGEFNSRENNKIFSLDLIEEMESTLEDVLASK
jgi:hypothetical protein